MLPRVDLIKTDEFDYLLFNSNDLITNFIKNHGFWGRTESNICQILTDGMDKSIVIDAGANLGGFTLPVAHHLQKQDGKVYCFEPQRIIFQQLCANIFINRLENVYAHNLVLGETSKSLMIPELDFEKAENIGGFSVEKSFRDFKKQFYSNPENKGIDPFVVEGITLDSLRLLKNVSFIKVDIEGAELEFFKGAREKTKARQRRRASARRASARRASARRGVCSHPSRISRHSNASAITLEEKRVPSG